MNVIYFVVRTWYVSNDIVAKYYHRVVLSIIVCLTFLLEIFSVDVDTEEHEYIKYINTKHVRI